MNSVSDSVVSPSSSSDCSDSSCTTVIGSVFIIALATSKVFGVVPTVVVVMGVLVFVFVLVVSLSFPLGVTGNLVEGPVFLMVDFEKVTVFFGVVISLVVAAIVSCVSFLASFKSYLAFFNLVCNFPAFCLYFSVDLKFL